MFSMNATPLTLLLSALLLSTKTSAEPVSGEASSKSLQVTHNPYASLWNENEEDIAAFLRPRWKTSKLANFRKRELSHYGEGLATGKNRSKRSRGKQCSSDNGGLIQDVIDGTIHGLKHFIHHGWKHDEEWGVALMKAENSEMDNEFLVEVEFGTPKKRTKKQVLKMVFDTGSPDTWVYSPACCYAEDHTFFDPSKSRTFSNRTVVDGKPTRAPDGTPGQKFDASYGSGSTLGYMGIDTVSFSNERIQVENQTIALATSLTASRASRAMEGLMGLSAGIGSVQDGATTTPFEAMSKAGQLNQTYLSCTLVKADRETGKNGGGQYVLGEIDSSRLKGEITWTPVRSAYFWGTYFDRMSIGDVVLSQPPATTAAPIRYMIDTGSAVINLPSAMARKANQQIQGSFYTNSSQVSQHWLVPCETGTVRYERSLPETKRNKPLSIQIEGTNFTVPVEDLVFYPNSPIPSKYTGGKKNLCYSAIQEGPEEISILGLTFIKNHVVVFDQGGQTLSNRRMGVGKRSDIRYD
ncbi:acid protease [Violaceomyces palustris]|uniref:Acid protease n=1 Tax=Violaceomyces palustris TaxID=1673888 RepID=A0ACD0NPU8_9BASI|nr:acid protease [Violaceomyces palustris]